MDFAQARRMMVDGQVRTADVTDLALIAAMLEIPRERFVPASKTALAYLDLAVLAIVLVSVFGSSLGLTILVIAFFSFAAIGRIVRGQALSQREKEYVEAAHSLGAGNMRIMFVDILPNLVAPVIVLATLLIPTAIIFEATLSFLGLGIALPSPSWGNMLSDAQGVGFQAWWFYIFPMIFLLLTTLAFNLLGDAVRYALDPRTERIFAARRKKKAAA